MTEKRKAKKTLSIGTEPIKFDFNPMQTRAALEAARVQEISQKYVDSLHEKILDLTNQSNLLRKQAAAIDSEIENLKKESSATEDIAKTSYQETLNLIISQFDSPEPPWKATIIVDRGLPVGVNLIKE